MIKANITYKEVDSPEDFVCASGHIAPKEFKRSKELEPTKFFKVSGTSCDGIFCEPCLILANYIAKRNKNGKR